MNSPVRVIIGNDEFVPLFSEEQIQQRIQELAKQISSEYKSAIPVSSGY